MMTWHTKFSLPYFILFFLIGCWTIVVGLSLTDLLTANWITVFFGGWLGFHLFLWNKFFFKANFKPVLKKLALVQQFWPFQGKELPFLSLIFTLWLVQGFFSMPNTTDAMTYHLPRVMFWLSERTVFPDSIYTINDFLSPFGDYLLLINLSVFKFDQLLFLNQLIAGIGCLWLVHRISYQLFRDPQIAWGSVAWALLIPSFALQSVSTQIELVTCFLILLTTTILVDFIQRPNRLSAFSFPLAAALAMLTKSTVIFFIPIWILYFVIQSGVKKLTLKLVLIGLLGSIIAFSMISTFLLQNLKLYDHPLGILQFETGKYSMTNEQLNVGSLASNLIRNSFIHLPIPVGNKLANTIVIHFHQLFHQPINDPHTTWLGTQFQIQRVLYPQEDVIGNPLHFLIVLVITIWILRLAEKPKHLVWIVASFWLFWIGFSVVLKWQPWHSRLHLPIFMLLTVAFPVFFKSNQQVQKTLLCISGLLSIILILGNFSRPYLPYPRFSIPLRTILPAEQYLPKPFYQSSRLEQYFSARPEWVAPILRSQIGTPTERQVETLCFELVDGFEYPFWGFLSHRLAEHVKTSRSCESSQADLQIATTHRASPYVERGFQCFPSDNQDKFFCWKERP